MEAGVDDIIPDGSKILWLEMVAEGLLGLVARHLRQPSFDLSRLRVGKCLPEARG